MKNLSTKKILEIVKILLFVYAGASVLVSIGKIFNIDFLEKIFTHLDMYFSITSVILYIFIYKRGEKKLAHIGFALLIAVYFLDFLQSFELFTYVGYYTKDFPSILLYPISYIVSTASNMVYYMALYTLIKTDNPDVNQFKKIHIYLYIASAIIGVIEPHLSGKFMNLVSSVVGDARTLFFGLVLVTYFLTKEEGNTSNTVMNQGMNPNMMNNMNNQMMNNMNQNPNMMNNMNNQMQMNNAMNNNMMNNQNNRFM